jgi:hypothetical protein
MARQFIRESIAIQQLTNQPTNNHLNSTLSRHDRQRLGIRRRDYNCPGIGGGGRILGRTDGGMDGGWFSRGGHVLHCRVMICFFAAAFYSFALQAPLVLVT